MGTLVFTKVDFIIKLPECLINCPFISFPQTKRHSYKNLLQKTFAVDKTEEV